MGTQPRPELDPANRLNTIGQMHRRSQDLDHHSDYTQLDVCIPVTRQYRLLAQRTWRERTWERSTHAPRPRKK